MNDCHICGNNTEWQCRDCDEPVCENCTVPYDRFTQIDYCLCNSCGGIQNKNRANEYAYELKMAKEKAKQREEKNEKSRIYYHSESAIKNRMQKKIEKQKLRIIAARERAEKLSEIFKSMFKNL